MEILSQAPIIMYEILPLVAVKNWNNNSLVYINNSYILTEWVNLLHFFVTSLNLNTTTSKNIELVKSQVNLLSPTIEPKKTPKS